MTFSVKFDIQAGLMTENTSQNIDPRPLHHRAMDQTGTIVAAVTPDQLTLPTPCDDYDVRALLSHIVGGLNRIAVAGEGGDSLAEPSHVDGVPDDGWVAVYAQAATRAGSAWADDAKLDTIFELPWGKIPGRFAVAGYLQEILTHGWDLAHATGQETERDPELAQFSLATAHRILPPEPRGGPRIPFGPPVEPSTDAGPYTQLAAYLGRQP
jgi:uncharacterized protein (TIGR03086 family)